MVSRSLMSCLFNSHIRKKKREMGTLRARTREYGSRGKVRASPRAADAAAAARDAIMEDAEEQLREMLELLMDSLEHLREEIAMDLGRLEYQFD